MEKRAVVYSLISHGLLSENLTYRQLLYSIDTINYYAPDLEIKVFLSLRDKTDIPRELNQRENVEVIEFDNVVDALYVPYVQTGTAELLDHRWKNLFAAFKRFSIDRVLFLDSDTFFSKSPHLLFDKYHDTGKFWVRRDVTGHISRPLGLDAGMNDGQFIMSRQIYNSVSHDFAERHRRAINELLVRAEKLLSKEDHRHLYWLSSQYSALRILAESGITIDWLSPVDASLSTEPMGAHAPLNCTMTSIVHHYFRGGTHRFLPKPYWNKLTGEVDLKSPPCKCGNYIRSEYSMKQASISEFYEDLKVNSPALAGKIELYRATFLAHRADKAGGHTYELIYSVLFNDRASVSNVAELGIYHGASLRAWRELFPNANITGLDRDSNFFLEDTRIKSYYVDQTVDSSLDIEFDMKFELFVDDASHIFEQSLRCFEKLKRLVKGYYVIEDIKTADLAKWKALDIKNSWLINMDYLRPALADNNMLVVQID